MGILSPERAGVGRRLPTPQAPERRCSFPQGLDNAAKLVACRTRRFWAGRHHAISALGTTTGFTTSPRLPKGRLGTPDSILGARGHCSNGRFFLYVDDCRGATNMHRQADFLREEKTASTENLTRPIEIQKAQTPPNTAMRGRICLFFATAVPSGTTISSPSVRAKTEVTGDLVARATKSEINPTRRTGRERGGLARPKIYALKKNGGFATNTYKRGKSPTCSGGTATVTGVTHRVFWPGRYGRRVPGGWPWFRECKLSPEVADSHEQTKLSRDQQWTCQASPLATARPEFGPTSPVEARAGVSNVGGPAENE